MAHFKKKKKKKKDFKNLPKWWNFAKSGHTVCSAKLKGLPWKINPVNCLIHYNKKIIFLQKGHSKKLSPITWYKIINNFTYLKYSKVFAYSINTFCFRCIVPTSLSMQHCHKEKSFKNILLSQKKNVKNKTH